MKHLYYILFLLPLVVIGQSQDQNYIKTSTYTQESSSSDDSKAIININYFDGLGRPLQSVAPKAGGNGEDVIIPNIYDAYGREAKKYLPYANVAQTASSLNYRDNTSLTTSTGLLYQQKYPTEITDNPYSETFFEASPLNRVLKQGAPGTDWKGIALTGSTTDYNDRTVKTAYLTNVSTGNATVKKLVATATWIPSQKLYDISFSNSGTYSNNQLYRTIVQNENITGVINTNSDISYASKLNTTEEFKNKLGQVILKRNFTSTTNTDASVTYSTLDTYYVYDQYGNLTYVIPPLAEGVLVDNLCYQYKYDNVNRLVEKKLPGKDWEYLVYDNQNRVVLTQDKELRKLNRWLYTAYDKFSRVAYTGQYNYLKSRVLMQDEVTAQMFTSVERFTTPVLKNGLNFYYSNPSYVTFANCELFTVNYYDDYNVSAGTLPTTVYNKTLITSTSAVNTKSLSTVAYVRALDSESWITNISAYDTKGRQIYSYVKDDFLNYNLTILTNLDFTGNVLETTTTNNKLSRFSSGGNSSSSWKSITLIDSYTYDNANRLLKHTQKADYDLFKTEELIVWNKYNEFGQLTEKKVGGMPGTDYASTIGLQTVNMGYNIRGWLKNINDTEILGTDLFAYTLKYNTTSFTGGVALYNGNISQTIWKTSYQPTYNRFYNYTYDNLNRLINAKNYGRSDGLIRTTALNYNEFLQYDKNGNITKLDRSGWLVGNAATTTTLDNLTYSYTGNQLDNVTDTGSTESFTDGNNAILTGYNDYSYDGNGNMTKDLNKKIGTAGANGIVYNHLNLPKSITFTNGDKIEYSYDAIGTKLRKTVTIIAPASVSVTEYNSGFVYTRTTVDPNNISPTFEFFSQPEGYVKRKSDATYSYVYQYKDHLGNVRLNYANNPQLLYSETFDSSYGGFYEKGGATKELQGGAITVTSTALYEGITKRISTTAVAGQRYRISITVDRYTCDKIRVFLSEANDTGWTEYSHVNIETGQNGSQILNFDYVIKSQPYFGITIDKIGDTDIGITKKFKILDFKAELVKVEVIEENNYYPFGLKHGGYGNATTTLGNTSAQKYKYNGKELQDENVGGGQLNLYYFGARNYDPALGRWMNIDKFAEGYEKFSPYVYAMNNPIFFIDPDGNKIQIGDHFYDYDSERDYDQVDEDERGIYKALDKLYLSGATNINFGTKENPKVINILDKLIKAKTIINIVDSKNGEFNFLTNKIFFADGFGISTATESGVSQNDINKASETGVATKGVGFNSSTSQLGHELLHAYNYLFDNGYTSNQSNPYIKGVGYGGRRLDISTITDDPNQRHYANGEEKYTTTLSNQINRALNEPERWDHRGAPVPMESSTSNKPLKVKPNE